MREAIVKYYTRLDENTNDSSMKLKEVVIPTWSINGGFVVVTFMRPTKGVIQGVTKDKEIDA